MTNRYNDGLRISAEAQVMIRTTQRPPSAGCTLPMYIGFLMSDPKSASCTRLSEIMGITHDSVNRFLLRESYEPKDLFNEAQLTLNGVGGTVSVDDSVLDKPYSIHRERVSYFWSGKHHRTVKGLNLITLYYTDPQGQHLPVNYRVYDTSLGKSKNDYVLEMLAEVLQWGLKPTFVTADSGYSCLTNLKKVKNHRMGFMFAVESNRLVSIQKGEWIQVQKIEVPDEGRVVWLKNFGQVKLFRTRLKNPLRHFVVYLADSTWSTFDRRAFVHQHNAHWNIEQYHRVIKQVCNIESFQVRGKVPILNHLFAALCAYIHLQRLCITEVISHVYHLQQDLFKEVIASFINSFILDKDYLNPKFRAVVNA